MLTNSVHFTPNELHLELDLYAGALATHIARRKSCLNTSMRGVVSCAVEGAEFPRGLSATLSWLFLTVFISHPGFPHGVFTLQTDVPDSPTADIMLIFFLQILSVDGKLLTQLLYHGELPTPPQFRFMVILPYSSSNTNFSTPTLHSSMKCLRAYPPWPKNAMNPKRLRGKVVGPAVQKI